VSTCWHSPALTQGCSGVITGVYRHLPAGVPAGMPGGMPVGGRPGSTDYVPQVLHATAARPSQYVAARPAMPAKGPAPLVNPLPQPQPPRPAGRNPAPAAGKAAANAPRASGIPVPPMPATAPKVAPPEPMMEEGADAMAASEGARRRRANVACACPH